MSLKKAIYPGTFDPITLGHLDVAKRALKVCDKLVIAVAGESSKSTLFSVEERVKLTKASLQDYFIEDFDRVEVLGFEGLLIDFVEKQKADIIVRGLRAVSDFEYEFQLASMNTRLKPQIQTIFIPASENSHFIASSLVKEVCRLGGNVTSFVTDNVKIALQNKF